MIALAVFAGIIAGHYSLPNGRYGFYPSDYGWYYLDLSKSGKNGLFPDVRLPIFALAVVYAGLFFLFGGKDAEPVPRRPRNWRRIIGVILAGLVIAGLSAAIIYSHYSHEEERRNEATRQANIEYEASKHRITSSEIDLIDLRLGRGLHGSGYHHLTGRIRNRAAHNRTLHSITLIVTLREKEGSDILGEQTVPIRVEVPPHQTRAISETIYFNDLPELTGYAWTYFISEIRGSKGFDFVPPPLDTLEPEVTPTPSPMAGGTWLDDPVVETVDPKTGKRKKIALSRNQ